MAFEAEIPKGQLRDTLTDLLDQLITISERNDCENQISIRILLLQFIQLLVKNDLVKDIDMGNRQNTKKELLSYLQKN